MLGTALAALTLLSHARLAEAAEITVLSAWGIMAVMEDLGPKFERASGHKLVLRFDGFTTVVKRVQGGESADVVVIPQQGIDSFVNSGKAAAGNVTVIARSGIGVVVRKGTPKPDISSSEALKRALLTAKSIAYPNPELGGPTGIHFDKMLDRLGIGNEMKPKTVFPKTPGGAEVGGLVARGEAEIGVHQVQELMPVAGIEMVGLLPADLQNTYVFSAAVMAGAKDIGASKALIDFLRTPEAAVVIKAKGMEPD
jgi:molybdate transport system substrate-binding protein